MAEIAPATVFLVGAGPGDPDLLTIKAARLIASADVIVHDGLVSAEILALASADAVARINAAIAALPASLKEVLLLRTIEIMSQADTAHLLGISEKAVETRLYRARSKLSEMLRDGSGERV